MSGIADMLSAIGQSVRGSLTDIGEATRLMGRERLDRDVFGRGDPEGSRRAGIADEVAASLKNNYPGVDWPKMVEYNLERMASHGIRRSDEMEQSAITLAELGVEPLMTTGTVARQRQLGDRLFGDA